MAVTESRALADGERPRKMSHTDEGGEPIPTYALRLTQRAQRDLDAATVHLAETTSPATAIAWREGLYEGLAALATFPRRCPLASERFGQRYVNGCIADPAAR